MALEKLLTEIPEFSSLDEKRRDLISHLLPLLIAKEIVSDVIEEVRKSSDKEIERMHQKITRCSQFLPAKYLYPLPGKLSYRTFH